MAKKKVGVTIEENLHALVKSLAATRHISVESAYDQALRVWVGENNNPVDNQSLSPALIRELLQTACTAITDKQLEALLKSRPVPSIPARRASGKS